MTSYRRAQINKGNNLLRGINAEATKEINVMKSLVAPADYTMVKAAEMEAEEDELEKTKDKEVKLLENRTVVTQRRL